MPFDPTRSELFDPFTGADIPVLKHVVFTPGVDSTFANPIHLQYVRDTMRGHGVQVVEEVSAGVQRTLLVFFGAAAGVFPTRSPTGDSAPWEMLADFGDTAAKPSTMPEGGRIGWVAIGAQEQVPLVTAIARLRPEPVVAAAPKDVRGEPLPFKLVQLHHFPATTWVGRAVFSPCEQEGDVPTWVDTDDEPPQDASEDGPPGPHPAYDVGVVTRYEPDPDFADLGHVRVHFVGSHGSMLHYTAWNLWTPVEGP